MEVSSLNESKDGDFPPISPELVKRLGDLIPEKCPDLDMNERDIFFYAGKRAVVRMLIEVFNEQNEVT